ncbi:MAG: GTP 3',8-cyclase MoaA [Candidatus Krumholzibacteriia bacterium]
MSVPVSAAPGALVDGRDRRISYLRLSVTSRCDLRCRYCRPCGGRAGDEIPPAGDLPLDQLALLAAVAAELGIRKLRITGGEPLLRPGLLPFLADVARLPGLERLVLTTNGTRLARDAAALRAAGVRGLNVSVDSLRPDRFRSITGGGDLTRVLDGVLAAEAAGLEVKLNVVLQRGVNDDEILAFAAFVAGRSLCVRFIEFMPTGGVVVDPFLTVPGAEVLARLRRTYTLEPRAGDALGGPARTFDLAGARGSVGVISAVSCGFCTSCNRIRVDASGRARGCLFAPDAVDLRPLLAARDRAGLAATLRRVVATKPPDHGGRPQTGCRMSMHRIGG